jgi:predicted RNase H-like HicB family nuclease
LLLFALRDGLEARGDTIVSVTLTLTWTAVFEPVEDGWVQARIEELPGVITAAPSADEAKELLLDALREYLSSFETPAEARQLVDEQRREALNVIVGA